MSFRCCKNDNGVSATTWRTRIRVWIPLSDHILLSSKVGKGTFRYSTNRFKNATKCSAFRMFPGIASFKRSSGNTENMRLLQRSKVMFDVHGLLIKPSVSLPSDIDSCRPSTSLAYSSCSLAASFVLTLRQLNKCCHYRAEDKLTHRFCLITWLHCGQRHPALVL